MKDRQPNASDLLDKVSFEDFCPLDQGDPPPKCPLETLPPTLRNWVVEVARAFQVPVELAVTQALGALSIAANGLGTVHTGGSWDAGLNLWLLTALPSGSNKSAVQAASLRAIRAYAEEERERMEPELAREREAQKIAGDQYESLRRSFRPSKKKSEWKTPGPEDMENLALLREKADAKLPEPPVYIMRNATTEAVEERLSLDGGIGALVSDESEILSNATGRYSNGANFDSLLPAHNGGSIDSVRKGKSIILVSRALLVINMVVQPVVLEKLATLPGDVVERGFVGRFLIVKPESIIGLRAFETVPVPDAVQDAYDDLITATLKRRREGETYIFDLSQAAMVAFGIFYESLEVRLKKGADLAGSASWVSKLEGACLRLSGLLHLAWFGPESGLEISGPTMQRAQELTRWFMAHLINAHRLMRSAPETREALKLWDFITRHAKVGDERDGDPNAVAQISQRDLGQAAKGTFFTKAELEGPLAMLIQQGYISRVRLSKTGSERRTQTVMVNPEAFSAPNPSPVSPLGRPEMLIGDIEDSSAPSDVS